MKITISISFLYLLLFGNANFVCVTQQTKGTDFGRISLIKKDSEKSIVENDFVLIEDSENDSENEFQQTNKIPQKKINSFCVKNRIGFLSSVQTANFPQISSSQMSYYKNFKSNHKTILPIYLLQGVFQI